MELPGEDELDLCALLPPEGKSWDAKKVDLWKKTCGQFKPPSAGSEKCVPGRISVVTPTTEARKRFHQILCACFAQQLWPNKELVVVETYVDHHSSFLEQHAKENPQMTYAKFQRPQGADWSIGLKRNIGTQLATGEFIANFDDDDLYAPRYLTTLVEGLRMQRSMGITLSSWYTFDTETSTFGYCNPIRWGYVKGYHETDRKVRQMAYGYGFSYMYRREAALQHPYPDQNMGEDFTFFSELMEAHGEKSVGLHEDTVGICLHTLHAGSTSDSVALWEVDKEEIRDLDISECDSFVPYTFAFPVKRELKNKHILDWLGKGQHLKMNPQRLYREVLAHTSFGNFKVTCRRGALKGDFLEAVEEQIGALPVETMVFRISADAQAPLEENERIGSYTADLWLAFPDEGRDSGATSGGSLGSTASPRRRSSRAVHVTVPAASARPPSACRIFHVDLPLEANIADLRTKLLPLGMAPWSQVFTFLPGSGRVELQDHDPVPAKVALSAFQGPITVDMVLTEEQARAWQAMFTGVLEKPEMQAALDELEAKAAGDFVKYFRSMTNFLNFKVFRSFVRHFGLPDDDRGPFLLFQAVAPHCATLEGHLATFRIEVLRRNQLALKAYREEPQWAWLRELLKIEGVEAGPPPREPPPPPREPPPPPAERGPLAAPRASPDPQKPAVAEASVGDKQDAALEHRPQLWVVVGGVGRGGIIVREGADTGSPLLPRLQSGSVVVGLERAGERLRFARLSGKGPEEGWVSIQRPDGQALLHRGRAWEVCGSGERDSIAVRQEQDVLSEEQPRLRAGSLVFELEAHGNRIRYVKMFGDGPSVGWISRILPSGQNLALPARLLLVVGSQISGGMVVRRDEGEKSPVDAKRLQPGAVLLQRERREGRLHYSLLLGHGPPSGWVNAANLEKRMLVPL